MCIKFSLLNLHRKLISVYKIQTHCPYILKKNFLMYKAMPIQIIYYDIAPRDRRSSIKMLSSTTFPFIFVNECTCIITQLKTHLLHKCYCCILFRTMALMNRTIAILARAKYSTSTFTNATTTAEVYRKDRKYLAQNYHPLPVAICRGKGNLNRLIIENRLKK